MAVAISALGLSKSFAIPTLQLDIANGTYDHDTDTIISPGTVFTLYAFLIPNSKNPLSDTYYISAAVAPKVGPLDSNLGSFQFNGTTVNATADMTYGVPPLEDIVALQGWDTGAGDLPTHGIFPTYFSQFEFSFSNTNHISPYNTQDRAISGNPIPSTGTGMYYAKFTVDTSGLDSEYVIHFDLYNTELLRNGDIDVTQFAPFSHDAQSTRVPEPHTILLLGIGFLGLWVCRKKFSKGTA